MFSRRSIRQNRGRVAERTGLPLMAMWLGSQDSTKPYLWGATQGLLDAGGTGMSGFIRPSVPAGRAVLGATFAPTGELWCWPIGGGVGATQDLMMFRPSTLRRGSPTPDRTLSVALTSGITRMVFVGTDAWVQTLSGFRVLKYTAAQLLAGGTPTPDVSLTFAAGTVSGAGVDLFFDASANMYAVYYGTGGGGGESGIAKVIPASYASTNAALIPDRLIGGNGSGNVRGYSGSCIGPDGTSGWVAIFGSDSVVKFTSAQLGTTAADPVPSVTLTSAAFSGPQNVAFRGGDLWVSNWTTGAVVRIPAAQLGVSGAVTPDVTITSGVANAACIAFAP